MDLVKTLPQEAQRNFYRAFLESGETCASQFAQKLVSIGHQKENEAEILRASKETEEVVQ